MKTRRVFFTIIALPFLLGLVGCDEDDWDNPFGEQTNLIVVNLTSEDVEVEIDQHQNGHIRYLGIVHAGETRKWKVDAGWAWLFIDYDAVEIYLDDEYDGWFEVRH